MSREDERDPSKPTAEPQARAERAPVSAAAADPKRVILARRASFIAAAMVGIACGKTTNDPPPMPCLSVAWVPPDAGATAPGDAEATSTPDVAAGADAAVSDRDASVADPLGEGGDGGRRLGRPPTPLSPAPAPHPCLSVQAPRPKTPSKQ
jgi:hypothetical protein